MTPPGLLVVGTDTGVGKTRVAATIARCLTEAGRRVGVLKPIATGADRESDHWRCRDAELLIAAIGGDVALSRVVPIIFEEPLAPPVAARRLGTPLEQVQIVDAVRETLVWWVDRAEVMVVEGIGGLLCPLAERTTMADLAIALDYPLVLVARRGLGTLNQTLLTVEAALRRGLRIAGIVLNGADPVSDPIVEATNPDELARRLDRIALLADLAHVEDPSALWDDVRGIDWWGLARPPRTIGDLGLWPSDPGRE